MSLLNGMYTQRFNREHGRVGHVFPNMVDDAGDWFWSSYQATSGKIAKPNFLHVNWLLSHFGNVKTEAKVAYIDFVRKDNASSPWKSLNGPDILGNDEFRGKLQGKIDKVPLADAGNVSETHIKEVWNGFVGGMQSNCDAVADALMAALASISSRREDMLEALLPDTIEPMLAWCGRC